MAIDWENYGRDRYEGRKAQSAAYQTHSYVEGNTVRQMSAVPKRKEEIEPGKAPKQYPQRKPVKMPGISGRAFVFLTLMLCVVVYTGFSYLSTQSELRKMKAEVVTLQSDIAEQKEENEYMYQSVVETVDLSEIYEKATKKLKMVQAESNQIYKYNRKKSDMVKQYADIPSTDD